MRVRGRSSTARTIAVLVVSVVVLISGNWATGRAFNLALGTPQSQRVDRPKWSATFPSSPRRDEYPSGDRTFVFEMATLGSDHYSVSEASVDPSQKYDLDVEVNAGVIFTGGKIVDYRSVIIDGAEARRYTSVSRKSGVLVERSGLEVYKDGYHLIVMASDEQGNNADRSKAFLDSFTLK